MGLMKVILKQDVSNLGEEGDVKEVKRGYARNFLFPRELALDFSKKNRIILEQRKAKIEQKRLQKKENANSLKSKLETETISVTISAGENGRLYGTVTTAVLSEELQKLGYEIGKKQIELKEHIKFAGTYKVKIHIYQTIYAEIPLEVIAKQEEKKDKRVRKSKRRHKEDNTKNNTDSNIDGSANNGTNQQDEETHSETADIENTQENSVNEGIENADVPGEENVD